MQGTLKKMRSQLAGDVDYTLLVGEEALPLNDVIGQSLTLEHTGNIFCDACGRKTNKSYSQGHCFPCMKKLARCDMCIMKPETCHFAAGTCREPEWGEAQCMVPHYVYLSNTSGLKVGITRHTQLPTRWIDQGATQGLPIIRVRSRYISGLVEVALGAFINDKTNWRAMLKGNNDDLDLKAQAHCLLPKIEEKLAAIRAEFGDDAYEILDESIVAIDYPVKQFPVKVASHNFDKTPLVSGILLGIKGQYLIFDTGVINIRKFTGYEVRVSR
ncbi:MULTISPECIES: DUF2797 domain-containing protein [Ferrimonas]|uniref:DUF2797 domain-containing protein n=1 Tax=Ferrimonas TaxID=44011 RepID=UPI00040E6658|nr:MULTISPECIES: DUF2797 domain-containing protein [Ferrimonas]USD36961.1 DUF2797 domain-containing protein [Ferrimonas sp. SCSIO 43195]